MENKNEIEAENIDEIIKDEFDKAKNAERFMPAPETERQRNAVHKIGKAIVKDIIEEPLPYYFSHKTAESLVNMIKRAKLNNYFAHTTFQFIEIELNAKLEKIEGKDSESNELKSAIDSLKYHAVRYFEEYLVEEFKDIHIAEILNRVKITLARTSEIDEKYFRKALLNIKEDVELRIELRKEELLNRSQIYEPTETSKESLNDKPEKIGERERRQKAKGLNRDVAYLFFDYLFEFAKINCNKTQKAEVVEILTGFSAKQLVKLPSLFDKYKLQIEDGDECDKNFIIDMQTVRKYFTNLGLIEIVEKIDKDLGN